MRLLNRHPFPVEASFEKSLVLSFAVRKEQLADRIPECLELDLFQDEWAFIAAAMVQTRHLRPAGFPKCFGRDFTLIGYRIFVRYRGANGRRLRGLYILGSETDKASMKRLGGIFTQYEYEIISIDWGCDHGNDSITSSAGLKVVATHGDESSPLPEQSPFPDWRKARQFAGPMPFTFSYDQPTNDVIIVEGQRELWTPEPMVIESWQIPFVDRLKLDGLVLANAFIVKKVPYRWKRGRVERWGG